MPYKDLTKDRQWHKHTMRERRRILRLECGFVTPDVTPPVIPTTLDADGQPIPDYD